MTAHVAKRAGAEVEAFAPILRMIIAIAEERPFGGDAKPMIPIKLGRHGISSVETGFAIAPEFTAPAMHFADLADRSRLDRAHDCAIEGARVILSAHLRDDAALAGDASQLPRF